MRAVTAAVPLRLRQAGALLAATMLVSCDRREATAPSAPTAVIQPAASLATDSRQARTAAPAITRTAAARA